MRAVRLAWGALALVACAEPPEELTMHSDDPVAKIESELDIPDELVATPVFSLCATLSDTYDYAPWAKEFVGNARCVKHTTIVPAMGFGTDHETSASFPEFTGLNIAGSGEETPAQKCRKAGIKVSVRWNNGAQVWSYDVPAVPTFGPLVSTSATNTFALADASVLALAPAQDLTLVRLSRVVSCKATHHGGLGGHGPGQYTITTSPYTGQPVVFPSIAVMRPMTSRVEAIF